MCVKKYQMLNMNIKAVNKTFKFLSPNKPYWRLNTPMLPRQSSQISVIKIRHSLTKSILRDCIIHLEETVD